MGKFPQEWKDAGYLEFLASELKSANVNGLKASVIASTLQEIASRVRSSNYADTTTGESAGEDNVPH